MNKLKFIKIFKVSIFSFLFFYFITTNTVYSFEFDIDQVITAIKNEIQTANISELGSPNFKIESVDVTLTVISTKTEKGESAVKIVGYDNEVENEVLTFKSHHNLSFSFQPVDESNLSPEISLGLVEPIKKVKYSLRKAYNTPPVFEMKNFTFKLEFAFLKKDDEEIGFSVIQLSDLKAMNVNTHYITIHMIIQN